MRFLEITKDKKDVWNDFILQNSPESFLQGFEWGEFQKAAGRKVFYYAVCEEDKILGLALAVEHKMPLKLKYWYLPRGPIILKSDKKDRQNENAILEFLMKSLKEQASKRGVIFLRMDPAVKKNRQDSFAGLGLNSISSHVQPGDTLILDLKKNEEEMLADMKQKTRYNIRLAEKKGVETFWVKFAPEDFEAFWQLIQETSKRDEIISHNREHYCKMLDVLSNKENKLQSRLYFARYHDDILASNIALFFGDYAVYLHGASSNLHRNLMAPYLLQWRQIQDARNAGCRIYDFWGITVNNENPKWEGITRFKKGFGGDEISYIGVYDLPVRKFLYGLYRILKNL